MLQVLLLALHEFRPVKLRELEPEKLLVFLVSTARLLIVGISLLGLEPSGVFPLVVSKKGRVAGDDVHDVELEVFLLEQ